MADIKTEIEKANAKFCEYVRSSNAKALGSLYTEKAYIMPPNSPTVMGRENIEGLWKVMFGSGLKDAVLTTVDIDGTGDTVTEMGKYLLKMQPEGEEAVEDEGQYVVLWKKKPEGWRLHWDIFNTSLPAT
jgi:ketosteroid isomerase-like protein